MTGNRGRRLTTFVAWVLATIAGFGSGVVLAGSIGARVASAAGEPSLMFVPWGFIITGLGVGTMLGAMQWLVLRRWVSRSGWWVLTTILGWTVSAFVVNSLSESLIICGTPVLAGAVLCGTMQWLVLRRQVSRAGWWVLANLVSWPMGWLVLVSVSELMGYGIAAQALGLVMAAVSPAVITGLVLVWLLRQARS